MRQEIPPTEQREEPYGPDESGDLDRDAQTPVAADDPDPDTVVDERRLRGGTEGDRDVDLDVDEGEFPPEPDADRAAADDVALGTPPEPDADRAAADDVAVGTARVPGALSAGETATMAPAGAMSPVATPPPAGAAVPVPEADREPEGAVPEADREPEAAVREAYREPERALPEADREPEAAAPDVDELRHDPRQDASDEAPTEMMPGEVPAQPLAAIWETDAAQGLRDRWREVQLRFVDDPRAAAQDAGSLLGEVVEALTGMLSARRQDLDSWQTGGRGDTEEMRVVLRRYRDLFDRLLGL
jgi:hypothetical protein